MNDSEVTLARLNRIADFTEDVLVTLEAVNQGRPLKSRISRLRSDYSLSIAAAKTDELINPLAECCEKLLNLMTDGKEFNPEKMQKIYEINTEIERMVS